MTEHVELIATLRTHGYCVEEYNREHGFSWSCGFATPCPDYEEVKAQHLADAVRGLQTRVATTHEGVRAGAELTDAEVQAHRCRLKQELCRGRHFHQDDVEQILAERTASNEGDERVADAAQTIALMPADHDPRTVVASILTGHTLGCTCTVCAFVRAGGAATDEALRRAAIVEWFMRDRYGDRLAECDAQMPEALAAYREMYGKQADSILAALDAAPAPTEDAHRPGCQEYPTGWLCVADCTTVWHDKPAVSRAAAPAAEEPRTEAQIKAEALREAAESAAAHSGDVIAWLRWDTAREFVAPWLYARADRLSRADEEAGS